MKTKFKPKHLFVSVIVLFAIIAAVPLLTGDVSGWGIKDLSCTDSDGGDDFHTPGEVEIKLIYKNKLKTNIYTDSCIYDEKVIEHFCFNNKLKKVEHDCPYGCESGACKYSICTDSDGGKDYYTKGIAVIEERTTETEIDYCLNANTLNEYFCASQEEIRAVEYVCAQGCANGVCF